MAIITDHEATVTPHQLCSICQPLLEFYLDTWDALSTDSFDFRNRKEKGKLNPDEIRRLTSSIRRHHASFEELQSAATQGCHLCALLANSIISEYRVPVQGNQFWVACYRESIGGVEAGSLPLWDERPLDCLEPRIGKVNIKLVGVSSATGQANLPPKESFDECRWEVSTGSTASLSMVKRWLRQCVEEHESCGYGLGDEDARPARLLDLNAFRDCEDLRLVDAADLQEKRYAALSYSWGNCVTTTLRASNLHHFKSRIPFEDLPRTIQETVEVCRRLSIRYLWVDALCIIQGSVSDFAHEVSLMGSIYANSLVTIAAADSSACNTGLFRDYLPLEVEDLVFSQKDRMLHVSSSKFDKCSNHAYWLKDSVLSSRAWTYQERALAPRTIHYDARRIVWECRKAAMCRRCEGSTYTASDALEVPKSVFEVLYPSGDRMAIKQKIQSLWSHTIDLYSKMLLSNEDDRLSALAGIAHLVQDRSSYKASYGLWLPFLADGLLWHAVGRDRNRKQNLEQYRAPSWSWISCPGEVTTYKPLPTSTYVKEKVVYQCAITAIPQSTPFTQLSTLSPTRLCLSGWLTSAAVAPHGIFSGHWCLVPLTSAGSGDPNSPPACSPLSWPWHYAQPPNPGIWGTNYFPDREYERVGATGQEVLCLIVKREVQDWGPGAKVRRRTVDRGLALRAVGVGKEVYRRVGYFEANLPEDLEAMEWGEVEIV